MKNSLGRLEPVPLRTEWPREDTDFTPWLAEEVNLALLGEALGMTLELVAREESVGAYSADLRCTNADDGTTVVIENQIERTDHSHLGQVVTYAAGLDASTLVWIAAKFTEEHRAAMDWLNEISHDTFRFFGLELELWKIGESPAAPKFNMVAKPNAWSRAVREAASGVTTELQGIRHAFWTSFLHHLRESGSPINGQRTPTKDPWMTWGIGRTGFLLSAPIGFRDGHVSAEMVVERDHESLHALKARGASIEADLGEPLTWDFDPNRKAHYARLRRTGVDPADREQWPELHEWLGEKLEALRRVFAPLVARIDDLEPLGDPAEGVSNGTVPADEVSR